MSQITRVSAVDRHWLLTWTTYGSWLPGDVRGFVSRVRVEDEAAHVVHNEPGTPYDRDMPKLAARSRAAMRGPAIRLAAEQAGIALEEFLATAAYREWLLCAAAVMANHVHLVVGVAGDPAPEKLLQVFKSYASRRLNATFGRPASETWWTSGGSRRKLPDARAVAAAVRYVERQRVPLALWTHARGLIAPSPRDL